METRRQFIKTVGAVGAGMALPWRFGTYSMCRLRFRPVRGPAATNMSGTATFSSTRSMT
jgi:hypothetical protein